jgi:hypothetical protein
MPVKEASSEETPYGRYITSDGWFVLNLADALAVRNEEKGGAMYPLEPQEPPFGDFGARVRVVWPGDPNALYHSEGVLEGFLSDADHDAVGDPCADLHCYTASASCSAITGGSGSRRTRRRSRTPCSFASFATAARIGFVCSARR